MQEISLSIPIAKRMKFFTRSVGYHNHVCGVADLASAQTLSRQQRDERPDVETETDIHVSACD
jgi:hypothetical protein